LEGDTLTLDLSNSVPEIDEDLTKMDLGELTVVSLDPATQVASPLGSFGYTQYNRAGYEASAGLVSIPLSPGTAQTLAARDLRLGDATGAPLLAELRLRGIPITPNLYLDEGDQGDGLVSSVRSRDSGNFAPAGHAVSVERQWRHDWQHTNRHGSARRADNPAHRASRPGHGLCSLLRHVRSAAGRS
jgi:hypothetical protein